MNKKTKNSNAKPTQQNKPQMKNQNSSAPLKQSKPISIRERYKGKVNNSGIKILEKLEKKGALNPQYNPDLYPMGELNPYKNR